MDKLNMQSDHNTPKCRWWY